MTPRLLPWPNRTVLQLRAHVGSLAVVAVVALAFLGLDYASGIVSGVATQIVIAIGVPLTLSSGGLGIMSGAGALWVQKPVKPLGYYMATTTHNLATSVGMVLILLVTLSFVALGLGWDAPTNPWRPMGALAAASLVAASMATGASMWLPRMGWLVTLAMFAFTLFLQVTVSLNQSLPGQTWVQWCFALLPPWQSVMLLGDPDGVDTFTGVQALGRMMLYAGAWVGIGALGVRRLLANGTLLRTQAS